MKNYIARTGTAAFVALTVVSLQAVPVQFGLNHYEFILVPDPFGNAGANNSWFAADAAAAASAFNSVNGHLATISSQAENDFLLSLVPVGLFTGFAG